MIRLEAWYHCIRWFELRMDWLMGCIKVSISFTMSGAPFAFSSRKPRYGDEISYRSDANARARRTEMAAVARGKKRQSAINAICFRGKCKFRYACTTSRRYAAAATAKSGTRGRAVGFDLYASHGSTVRSMIYTCRDAGKWRSRGNCGERTLFPGGTRSDGAGRLINQFWRRSAVLTMSLTGTRRVLTKD